MRAVGIGVASEHSESGVCEEVVPEGVEARDEEAGQRFSCRVEANEVRREARDGEDAVVGIEELRESDAATLNVPLSGGRRRTTDAARCWP